MTFECSLEGKPLSVVTWWHGNTKIESVSRYSVSGPPLVSNSKASLTITNVVRDDEGFYYCKANNDLGTVESDSAYLTVNCKWNRCHRYLGENANLHYCTGCYNS